MKTEKTFENNGRIPLAITTIRVPISIKIACHNFIKPVNARTIAMILIATENATFSNINDLVSFPICIVEESFVKLFVRSTTSAAFTAIAEPAAPIATPTSAARKSKT